MKAARVMTAVLLLAADDPMGMVWTFEDVKAEDVKAGQLPEGWSAAKTGGLTFGRCLSGSVWKVVEDETPPDGRNLLAQAAPDCPNPLFNLCVLAEGIDGDVDISVSFKAVAAKIDRGGGPVWRYRDADNDYICRHNPLENNFRLYTAIDGKRTPLASADSKAASGTGHTIKVGTAPKRAAFLPAE